MDTLCTTIPTLIRALRASLISLSLTVAVGCTSETPVDTGATDSAMDEGTAGGGDSTTETPGCGDPLLDCDGSCVDPRFDPSNCGGCGVACGEGEVCADGTCALSCGAGTTACDGVCVDTAVDPAHCGGCGVTCAADEFCQAGVCSFKCSGGTVFCGDACVNTSSDPAHCGGCNVECGAGEVCDSGACALQCPPGTADCGGSCVATDLDPANCGACEAACAAGEACVAGTCTSSCGGGTESCNDVCVDTSVDPANCGGCGVACNAGEYCDQGSCTSSCGGTTVACNGGCVDTAVDPANCGGCGDACAAGLVCAAGLCQLQCAGGSTDCLGSCVTLDTDPGNCGACGNTCTAGEFCSGGVCDTECGAGTLECSGQCVDTQTDEANCGACGNACGAGGVCTGGTCQLSCGSGTVNCSGTCVDSDVDPANCGACGVACGAGEVCSAGTCAPNCVPPLQECGGGCVDTASDPANCGGCGVVCGPQDACTNQTCQLACGNGQVDPGEVCDVNAPPAECTDFGFSMPGPVLCRPDCLAYDWNVSFCPTMCGDGTVEPGEDCDLGGGSSADCDADCSFPVCRDGVLNVEAGEAYDESDLGLRRFATLAPTLSANDFFGTDVAVGDFDGDLLLDLVVTARFADVGGVNQSEGTLHVYLNDGVGLAPSGQAPLAGEFNLSGFGDHLGYSVAVADVNLDTFDDIIAGATRLQTTIVDEGGAKVFLSNGDGTFNTTPTVISAGVQDSGAGTDVVATDLNGDDIPDVLLGAPFLPNLVDFNGGVYVALGDGSGNFAPPSTVLGPVTGGFFGESIAVADLDGDDVPDLISGSHRATNSAMQSSAGVVYWMPGLGDGTFGAAQVVTEGVVANGELGHTVTVADVDGDGAQDVLASYMVYDAVTFGSNEGAIWIGYGDGAGGFVEEDLLVGLPGSGDTNELLVVDANADGLNDVIRGSWSFTNGQYYEGATLVHLATGVREFNDPARAVETNQASSGANAGLASADFDNDGLNEIVVGVWQSDSVAQDAGEVFIYSSCEAIPFF